MPEKVEIVQFSEDPATYVANALSPARSMRVVIDPEQNLADVQVASDMVSLAIGREGQNSRLARADRLADQYPGCRPARQAAFRGCP